MDQEYATNKDELQDRTLSSPQCDLGITTSDGRFAMANFFQPSQYFVNIHLNSLVIRFFSLPERKIPTTNRASGVANQSRNM